MRLTGRTRHQRQPMLRMLRTGRRSEPAASAAHHVRPTAIPPSSPAHNALIRLHDGCPNIASEYRDPPRHRTPALPRSRTSSDAVRGATCRTVFGLHWPPAARGKPPTVRYVDHADRRLGSRRALADNRASAVPSGSSVAAALTVRQPGQVTLACSRAQPLRAGVIPVLRPARQDPRGAVHLTDGLS